MTPEDTCTCVNHSRDPVGKILIYVALEIYHYKLRKRNCFGSDSITVCGVSLLESRTRSFACEEYHSSTQNQKQVAFFVVGIMKIFWLWKVS